MSLWPHLRKLAQSAGLARTPVGIFNSRLKHAAQLEANHAVSNEQLVRIVDDALADLAARDCLTTYPGAVEAACARALPGTLLEARLGKEHYFIEIASGHGDTTTVYSLASYQVDLDQILGKPATEIFDGIAALADKFHFTKEQLAAAYKGGWKASEDNSLLEAELGVAYHSAGLALDPSNTGDAGGLAGWTVKLDLATGKNQEEIIAHIDALSAEHRFTPQQQASAYLEAGNCVDHKGTTLMRASFAVSFFRSRLMIDPTRTDDAYCLVCSRATEANLRGLKDEALVDACTKALAEAVSLCSDEKAKQFALEGIANNDLREKVEWAYDTRFAQVADQGYQNQLRDTVITGIQLEAMQRGSAQLAEQLGQQKADLLNRRRDIAARIHMGVRAAPSPAAAPAPAAS